MDEINEQGQARACSFTPGERSLPPEIEEELKEQVRHAEHPREMAVDVMYALQNHYGYFSDAALDHACDILGMTHVELEELATFYDYIYREPVGKYVIHVCDGVVCYLHHDDAFSCARRSAWASARPRRTGFSPSCPRPASATATRRPPCS